MTHRYPVPRSAPGPRSAPRAVRTAIASLVAALVLAVVVAPSAAAHVTVTPSSSAPGGYAVLTFKVPTESLTASTVGLKVLLPTDTPLTSVRTAPVPGWQAEITTEDLPRRVTDDHGNEITSAPTAVTWTATGDGLAPDEFGEFKLAVGPLPESGTVHLPAVQTYSDGTGVEWVQQAQGDAEPERPAPSFDIDAAAGVASTGQDAHGTATDAGPADATTADAGASGTDGRSPWSIALLVAAVVVSLGVATVALTVAARASRSRPRP